LCDNIEMDAYMHAYFNNFLHVHARTDRHTHAFMYDRQNLNLVRLGYICKWIVLSVLTTCFVFSFLTRFNTAEFILKSHVKTDLVLTALKRRYTVLLVDLDIVFLKNPIASVRAQCGNCDIAIQNDGTEVNITLHTDCLTVQYY